jgi:hypothetical protein
MSNNTVGVQALSQSGGVVSFASGLYTGDGSGSMQVYIGFMPRHVFVLDVTDNTSWEWMEGMPATDTLKNAAGTQTIDTGSAIVTSSDIITVTEVEPEGTPGQQGPGEGNQGTVTISIDSPLKTTPNLTLATGLNTSAKVYVWKAMA